MLKIECRQEEGYARRLFISDGSFSIMVDITEGEARNLVSQIAFGFGNLVTSDHIWTPVKEAVQ